MKLIVQDLVKSFGTKQVLKGASYTFAKEGIYGLLGRNGAGKTTLFNCLSAEYPPDSGSVSLSLAGEAPAPWARGTWAMCCPPRWCRNFSPGTSSSVLPGDHRRPGNDGAHPRRLAGPGGIEKDDRHRLMRGYSTA